MKFSGRLICFLIYRAFIDEDAASTGRFILTGSQNFLLLENIVQSPPGRIAFIYLLPFSYEELKATEWKDNTPDFLILHGGYPRLYDKSIAPTDYYPNYILTGCCKCLNCIFMIQVCAARCWKLRTRYNWRIILYGERCLKTLFCWNY